VTRMYDLMRDAWGDDRITADDVVASFTHFLGQCDETKVFFLFSLFDRDDSGSLSCSELRQVLVDTVKDNGIIFDEDEVRQLAGVLIEELVGPGVKCSRSVKISYKDMRRLLDLERGLAAAIAGSLYNWLVPPEPKKKGGFFSLPEQFTSHYIRNNLQLVFFVSLLALAILFSFLFRALQFGDFKTADGRPCWELILARGSGKRLSFHVIK